MLHAAAITTALALVGCERSDDDASVTAAPPALETILADIDTLIAGQSEQLGLISALAVGPDGAVWVADEANHRLLAYHPGDGAIEFIGREGAGPGEFRRPRAVAASDSLLAVLDFLNRRVQWLTPDGVFVASRPVVEDVLMPTSMASSGALAGGVMGWGGSLAVIVGPDRDARAFRGEARADRPIEISVSRLRRQANEGQVPDEFENNVLPVLGEDGSLWLLIQAEGRIEHYSPEGALRWTRDLDQPEVDAALARFFRQWQGPVDMRTIPIPWIARWGVARGADLWLMTDSVEADGSVLLRLDAASGEVLYRMVLPITSRAGPFGIDPSGRYVYFGVPEEASLLRARIPEPQVSLR